MSCRKCSECKRLSHHWIENEELGDEESELCDYTHTCQHCDAVGNECVACDGDGQDRASSLGDDMMPCGECNGEGVIFCEQKKPSLKVSSVFGQSEIEASDGTNTVTLKLTKRGVSRLIDELQTVLEIADDDEDED